jgi:hypothetical protein
MYQLPDSFELDHIDNQIKLGDTVRKHYLRERESSDHIPRADETLVREALLSALLKKTVGFSACE